MKGAQKISPFFIIFILLVSRVQSLHIFATNHRTEPKKQSFHLGHGQQSSYVIYHNMRNLQFSQHNHVFHFSENSQSENPQTYGINSMGYFFTINMTVQGIPYSLNIDTGSSDLFIKGQNSQGKPDQKYSCPRCQKENNHISISFLDGTLNTYEKEVNIVFGQHQFSENILVAYYAPKTFEIPQGIVGLSFPSLAKNPYPTFIQTLINNHFIEKYAFGVNLNFQNNETSSITFGQPDYQKFQGPLIKVPILSTHSYIIGISSVQIADSSHLPIQQALLDTGNSCISLPNRFESVILQQFNKGPNKCGFCKEPLAPMFSLLRCKVTNFQALPSVNIYVKLKRFEIDKDAYIQRCVKDGEQSLCDLYIESSAGVINAIIGDAFFNRVYAYFDIQSSQVGLAKNKETLSYKSTFKPYKELDNQDIQFFNNLKKK